VAMRTAEIFRVVEISGTEGDSRTNFHRLMALQSDPVWAAENSLSIALNAFRICRH